MHTQAPDCSVTAGLITAGSIKRGLCHPGRAGPGNWSRVQDTPVHMCVQSPSIQQAVSGYTHEPRSQASGPQATRRTPVCRRTRREEGPGARDTWTMPGRGQGWHIGYCLPEQKKRKLNFQDFEALCRERGHEVVELDLGRPLSPQGPFDVILHKPSDLLLAADYDIHAQRLVDDFQAYTDAHARTLVLDPLPAVRPLLDRFESCRLLRDLRTQDNSIFSPPCVELPGGSGHEALGQVLARGLTFPLICKTRVAHGPDSHQMTLVFNEEGLGDVRGPCLLQSFVNHDAALFKVFVVGDAHFVVRRPSLRNFPRGRSACGSIFFDSREVSKPESCSRLTELEQSGLGPTPPAASVVGRAARGLRAALGLSLFGVDLIVERQTGRCAAIDLNAFPGYEGVPEFFPALLSHIETLLETREREEPPSSPPETP